MSDSTSLKQKNEKKATPAESKRAALTSPPPGADDHAAPSPLNGSALKAPLPSDRLLELRAELAGVRQLVAVVRREGDVEEQRIGELQGEGQRLEDALVAAETDRLLGKKSEGDTKRI
jgi:hypothetical protein